MINVKWKMENDSDLHSLLAGALLLFSVRGIIAIAILVVVTSSAVAQQTNPVDRKVTNPMTDTPNVNPLIQDQPIRPRPAQTTGQGVSTDRFQVDAATQTATGPENARVVVYEGNVDARIGTYRLQADKVTVYEATNRVIAEGNVVFDQADQQRITGTRAEWNYRSKTGFFVDSTGFTNQTEDGTRIFFTADRVEDRKSTRLNSSHSQI